MKRVLMLILVLSIVLTACGKVPDSNENAEPTAATSGTDMNVQTSESIDSFDFTNEFIDIEEGTPMLLDEYEKYTEINQKISDYSVSIVLTPKETLTDVSVFNLGWFGREDTVVYYNDGEIYNSNQIIPGEHLRLWVDFPGVLDTTGIAFTDSCGENHVFLFRMRGDDGTLFLREWPLDELEAPPK